MARSSTRNLKSLRGMSNVPLPVAVNSASPEIGTCLNLIASTRSTGIRRPSALNEYVESQPMNAAPVMLPARSKPMSIP